MNVSDKGGERVKYRIFVFPAGTEMAFEISNALKYAKMIELLGGTSRPCHAEFAFKTCVQGIPFVDDENFIDRLNDIIREYDIDYIYPAHDSVLLKLTENMARVGAKVVTSPLETVQICRSKRRTYEYLSGEPYLPQTFSLGEDLPYPVFIKPSVGQGAQGAMRIDCREQLELALKSGGEYVICEYLPGEEYTADCFTDRHGKLRVAKLRVRERIRAGIAVRSRLLPTDSEVFSIAESLNSHFTFNGAWFFQLKKNAAGDYRLMEVSPRIPGTMAVSRNLGINFPLLTLYNMWGYDVDIIDNGAEILLDRAFISRFETDIKYDNIYIDFDDTLIVNGMVNIQLISFLYQSLNNNKRIFLLTKHTGDIYAALDQYHIAAGLFAEIIHIGRTEEKINYINPENSIFIDDSFSERKCVKDRFGIPVFDLDMVESLLDQRS